MKNFKVGLNKIIDLNKRFTFFIMPIFIFAMVTSFIFSFFKLEGVTIFLILCLRFVLLFLSLILLAKVLQTHNSNLVGKTNQNYAKISLISVIAFSLIFPLSIEGYFLVERTGSILLMFSFFLIFIAYLLNRNMVSLLRNFSTRVYESLLKNIKLIVLIPYRLIIHFYNSVIKVKFLFRKMINIFISHFNQVIRIQHICQIDSDTSFNSFFNK